MNSHHKGHIGAESSQGFLGALGQDYDKLFCGGTVHRSFEEGSGEFYAQKGYSE